jgi:hypothetical protein
MDDIHWRSTTCFEAHKRTNIENGCRSAKVFGNILSAKYLIGGLNGVKKSGSFVNFGLLVLRGVSSMEALKM